MLDGVPSNAFYPVIATTFESHDTVASHHRFIESNDQVGKIVVTPQ